MRCQPTMLLLFKSYVVVENHKINEMPKQPFLKCAESIEISFSSAPVSPIPAFCSEFQLPF